MKISLTDRGAATLKPGTYFDTKTPAFGLRVGKYRRTWIVTKGRERQVLTLGHYPAMSLQEARQSAYIALGSPLARKTAPTFPDALEAFLAQNRWRPRTLVVLRSSLRHFQWTRPIDKITHEDVASVLDQIEGISARAHALKDIRAFFNWCVPRYLPDSPVQGFRMPAYKPRQRVLTDDELKRVWIAAEELGTFGCIIRLLILTGQRRSEIATLTWEQIEDDRIILPETKNGREHTFPRSNLTSSLLTALPTSHGLLFPAKGKGGSPYNGWGKHHQQLLEKSGTSDWTIHDLRRTFATGLASLGVPIHVTEKILNHVSGTTGGIVSVYQRHSYWDEQKAALQAWEDRIQSLVAR